LGAPLGGCPEGFQLLGVAALEQMGPYALPPLIDAAGNDDGWVCGNALPPGEEQNRCNKEGPGSVPCQLIALGLPTYEFTDNDVPGHTG
jgi:hypothetical protein